ncbi:MAG: hypothetical protein ISS88_01085 [Candidatus Portnoybacteria bacterium]|nr:hypothetical protein [Candidatus Portnoybacteria bacterium]
MKTNLFLIGFLQALGVIAYCALAGGFFWLADRFFTTPPGFLGIVLMLVFLVFSVAVSGTIVFGYPAYLALNQRVREALSLLIYTLLYILGFVIIIVIIVTALGV